VPPQPLQVVVAAGSIEEYVDDEVAVVHQDPFGVVVSLHIDRQIAPLLESEVNLIGDGLILADVRSSTDDEMIGEAGDIA
jgi:hypothetical protein